MPQSPDVLLIGGGVIGLTTAYFLARKGLSVEVVDKSDFGQEASWAGAGILPPGKFSATLPPYDQLRALSADLFPNLSAELKEKTGIDNGYFRSGGLELIESGEADNAHEWRGEGIDFEEVSGEQLHHLEPALAGGHDCAYFLPGMAQVRNPRHLKALLAGCSQLGVRLRSACPVERLECQGEQVVAVQTGQGSLTANRFLISAGAWTDPLLEQFGFRAGIRPVRGQIALLNSGAPFLHRILVLGKRYLVPRSDGRILVGSTEENAGFDKRTTAAAIADLLQFAINLVPALAQAQVERTWAGLRPGSPDGLPYIGAVPNCSNLFLAAGHYRAGIQLSPATALVLQELLLGHDPSVPLADFRLDRGPAVQSRPTFRS